MKILTMEIPGTIQATQTMKRIIATRVIAVGTGIISYLMLKCKIAIITRI